LIIEHFVAPGEIKCPFNDGSELTTLKEPRQSYPILMATERPEEFAPGLDRKLQQLADAFSEFKENMLAAEKTNSIKKSKQ
jgi:Mn-containing catalase